MQTAGTYITAPSGAAAETPWTYKDVPQEAVAVAEAEAENDHAPVFRALAACGLTAALNIIATQINNPKISGQRCSSSTASAYTSYLDSSGINPQNWCQAWLVWVAVMTCLHWGCIFSFFNKRRRWKTEFLPHIIMITLFTLLPLATITRDTTTVFVQLLPVVTDVYVVAALLIDCSLQKRLTVEDAC